MRSTVSLQAYAVASTPSVRDVAALLLPAPLGERVMKTQLTAHTGPDQWVVAYDFGAVVFVGYGEDERAAVMARLVSKLGPEPHPPMHEEFPVELDPAGPMEVLFDRVRLPLLDEHTVEVVALVVAQSVAMEYYEEDVELLMTQVQARMRELEERGRFRGSLRQLVRFVGSGMSTRNQVVATLALLDTPDLAWNDERLASVHRGLRKTFEIEDRYRALDHKLRLVQDSLEILVDLGHTRRALTLEVAVVALIAFEILIALSRH